MKPAVLAVSGWKNSGKTTLIEALLPRLAKAGLRVAVIKHDGHSFSPEVPGTDTHRFLQAGALGTAVFDGEKFMAVRRTAADVPYLMSLFPEADLILLEGLKDSPWPKLWLEDGAVSCSFSPARFDRDQVPEIARMILQELSSGKDFTALQDDNAQEVS